MGLLWGLNEFMGGGAFRSIWHKINSYKIILLSVRSILTSSLYVPYAFVQNPSYGFRCRLWGPELRSTQRRLGLSPFCKTGVILTDLLQGGCDQVKACREV